MARLWIVSYDIADPIRLRHVAEVLEACGERVQESVFECWLDRWRLHQLRAEINRLINPSEDGVRYYPLCGGCVTRMRWHGSGDAPGGATYWVV